MQAHKALDPDQYPDSGITEFIDSWYFVYHDKRSDCVVSASVTKLGVHIFIFLHVHICCCCCCCCDIQADLHDSIVGAATNVAGQKQRS